MNRARATVMKMSMQMRDLDPERRKRIARETIKEFPQARSVLKEYVKSINELFYDEQ